ncbi:MAG: L-threonylcarbamoyladenylate synthase [Bacteroidia bacterium]
MNLGSDIQQAIDCLINAKLVAIPTETVYGLAANAFDVNAVAKIFSVKNRPQFNPLIIHSNSLQRFEKWGIAITDKAKKLAEKFSPGPLTYVLPKSQIIPDLVTAGHQSVAIRIPKHPLTQQLLSKIDFPLAAPSANPSGYVSPTTAQHVAQQLKQKVCYILDGGPCKVGIESTILSLVDTTPVLLRYGSITVEEMEAELNQKIDVSKVVNNDNPLAPGMLGKHYATKTPLIIGHNIDFKVDDLNKIAAIRLKNYLPQIPQQNQILLSPEGSLETAAANLYTAMRNLDDMQFDLIIAEPMPSKGLGIAINDRLKRAAAKD